MSQSRCRGHKDGDCADADKEKWNACKVLGRYSKQPCFKFQWDEREVVKDVKSRFGFERLLRHFDKLPPHIRSPLDGDADFVRFREEALGVENDGAAAASSSSSQPPSKDNHTPSAMRKRNAQVAFPENEQGTAIDNSKEWPAQSVKVGSKKKKKKRSAQATSSEQPQTKLSPRPILIQPHWQIAINRYHCKCCYAIDHLSNSKCPSFATAACEYCGADGHLVVCCPVMQGLCMDCFKRGHR
jgi:hypothetical protein